MPHVIIEYSGNIRSWGDPARIGRAVHDALCALPHISEAAVKTRAICHDIWWAGPDEKDTKGFVTVLIRTRPGREDHILQEISGKARDAVLGSTVAVAGKTLSVSVEVQMMDPVAVMHAKV